MTFLDEIKLLKKKVYLLQQPDYLLNHLMIKKKTFLYDASDWVDLEGTRHYVVFDNDDNNELFDISEGYDSFEYHGNDLLARLLEKFIYEYREHGGSKDGLVPLKICITYINELFDIRAYLHYGILKLIFKYHSDLKKEYFDLIKKYFSHIDSSLENEFLEFDYEGFRYKVNHYNFEDKIGYVTLKSVSGIPGLSIVSLPSSFLKEISIPNAIVFGFVINTIDYNAFDNLYDTEIINLPDTLENLKANFWNCKNLKKIICNSDNYKSLDGVLYSADYKELIAFPNQNCNFYEIPENVEVIKKDAFKDCNNIEIIRIPSTLKQIECNAFYRCENLKIIACNMEYQKFKFVPPYGDYGFLPLDFYFTKKIH